MSTLFEKLSNFVDVIGGQRVIDIISSLVIFVVLMGLAWFLWRRRHVAQSSQIRSLESEQLRLTEELATLLQRYEIALRGSSVTVFTQDRDLRYTSISNPFLGFKIEEILGRTDNELIPVENRPPVVSVKQEVLQSGEAKDREVQINDGQIVRWYDFHIEPLRDNKRRVIGISCAVVDITASKEGEEHLRLLMRELTHRSKNLLAMIQAIARQTARYSGSIDGFLGQFNARVQALARSHDLLVQESWHGATLKDLLHSQLGPYVDTEMSQVTINGPPISLKPETAQSIGLALHELASNASKYGALSVPTGRISITWSPISKLDQNDMEGIEILWAEKGGPTVGVPSKRGFGSMVIQNNLARTLESNVDLTFAEDGVNCLIRVPEAHLFSLNTAIRQPKS
jgi:PAS domain S-box-containing protein